MPVGYQWSEPQMMMLGPSASAARSARDFVRHRAKGRVPARIFDNMELVASELVTNAIVHGRQSPVALKVLVTRHRARVAVTSREVEGSSVPPVSAWKLTGLTPGAARGLAMVRSASNRVGLRRHRDLVTVFAKFRY